VNCPSFEDVRQVNYSDVRSVRAPAAARSKIASGAGQIVPCADYLRAAQAYMLISMPTGTSTIFGVFHVI
jgi:hypothetical protein